MQTYELQVIVDNLLFSTKQDWERTRFQSYVTAQTQSSKQLELTDILRFNWDKEEVQVDTTVSQDDRNRLISKMKLIEENNKRKNRQ